MIKIVWRLLCIEAPLNEVFSVWRILSLDIDGLDFLQWQTGLQTAGYDRDLTKPESCLEAAQKMATYAWSLPNLPFDIL